MISSRTGEGASPSVTASPSSRRPPANPPGPLADGTAGLPKGLPPESRHSMNAARVRQGALPYLLVTLGLP